MKERILIYAGLVVGSFFIGFLTFYFLMPVIVRQSRTVDVPHLKHMSLKEAKDFLSSLGNFIFPGPLLTRVIINIPVEMEDDDTVSKDGTVIKTKPSIEDSLEKGGKLTIFIGKEKRKVFLMPNLIGLPLDEAKEILTDFELELAPIRWTKSDREEVLLQSPLAGVEVTFGDTIKLIVGQK